MSDFKHLIKEFPQDDGTVVLECACAWGVTLQGWEGEDENGSRVGRKASKFTEAFKDAHMLLNWEWPWRESDPPSNWTPGERE